MGGGWGIDVVGHSPGRRIDGGSSPKCRRACEGERGGHVETTPKINVSGANQGGDISEWDAHPQWKAEKIRGEFASKFPTEPNQPSANKIQKLVYYKRMDDVTAGKDWRPYSKLAHAERPKYSTLMQEAMKRAIAQASPDDDRRTIIRAASRAFHEQSNGVKVQLGTFDNVYWQMTGEADRRKSAPPKNRMTADEKRQIVYRIADENPHFSNRHIAAEFKNKYPNEPDPPSNENVRNYLLYRNMQPREGVLRWSDLTREDREKFSILGRKKAEEVANKLPMHSRTEKVKVALDEMYAEHGVRIRPESMQQWIPRRDK